jgi:nucleotidyltransferase AbiEii toxin of type IV toxin-antitoxin system
VADANDDGYSRAPEPEDLIRICRALNEAQALYVVIGGFAVIAHGAGRFTKDIDLLVEDSPENVSRVKRGLSVLADNAVAEVNDTDIRDYVVVRVADEVMVDLMGRACGLAYADVARDMEWLELSGVRVPVASPATLIRTKDTPRPQDAVDRGFLEGVLLQRDAKT